MIDKPGIFQVSAKDYHADPCVEPSLSSSVANILLSKSPAHARMCSPRLYPDYVREDTSRLELGTAAHSLLLEQDGSNIVFCPFDDWRKNDAKAMRDEARNNGKLPILSRYEGVLRRMVEVANQAMADSEFGGWPKGKPEQTLVWNEMTVDANDIPRGGGIWCRARPDWLTDDRSLILDYKSSESAEPEFAIRQLDRMGYAMAAEFYLRGMAALGHPAETKYVFLFQEIESPFACSFVSLANSYREIAQDKVTRAINTWRMCLAADKWPAYRLDIHYAEPAAWQLAEYEARLDAAGRTW